MLSIMKEPFDLDQFQKRELLLSELVRLTKWHAARCQPYEKIMSHTTDPVQAYSSLQELPFLPVQLFKMLDLYSVPREHIVKTLTSSGTTGQQVSKIYLDKETSLLQSKSLVSIMSTLLGNKRLPMMIIDSSHVIKDRKSFSARGAGIVGFSNFGRDHLYALDEQYTPAWEKIEAFLEEHGGETILLFGFTYMVWQYLYKTSLEQNRRWDLSNCILIHGGGWKKLQDEAVSNDDFKLALQNQWGIRRVHNYYGMVEQVGSIFIECEKGFFHTPSFADILVRDPNTLTPLSVGQQGLLQVFSLLPKSYPGHSLLTEDLGIWHGEDDCACGRLGKYFTVQGRLPKAELRGCSDTHAFDRREANA